MNDVNLRDLPVAVIGAGPIGLAAAAHLVSRGERPLVLEAGDTVGASIRAWSHVTLFSPWRYLTDPVSCEMLVWAGCTAPEGEGLATGGELVERYLEPLAAHPAIAPHLRLGRRVVAVSRLGFDKVRSAGRDGAPFQLRVSRSDGGTERHLARAVIDASGTWTSPNPMGASGLPAEGEVGAADRIHYGIPDALAKDRGRYRGRRTLVVGSGHSALNAVLDLAALAQRERRGEVIWGVRGTRTDRIFGGGEADALPARAGLGRRTRPLVEGERVRLVTGFGVERVVREGDALRVEAADGRAVGPVDEIVVATGFRPDLAMVRELRLALDSWLEAPALLAPLIDPNVHSCGTVHPHGFQELSHPESDFFTVGMKSYGRAPTFLLLTGYEQVRSVVCALTGDLEGARAVELLLPQTGVCSGGSAASACCSPPVALSATIQAPG